MFNFLKGYKSIIGSVGAVATFITVLCSALVDGFQMGDVSIVMAAFSAMMLAIGWTGKLMGMEKTVKK